jgi:integrase
VSAAGLPESTTPYALRHSGISWALSAGIPATDVARFGGTSLAMLERTYAHLLTSSAESARARLDAFAVTIGSATTEASEQS